MKRPYSILAILCLSATSCDQAKKMASDAKAAIQSGIAKNATGTSDAKPDAELQKLVDETPEGILFRKDLPFPSQVEVITTRSHEISSREFETSAIDVKKQTVKGTETLTTQCEWGNGQVSYTRIEHHFVEPMVKGADPSKPPVPKQISPPSKPCVFIKSGSVWKPASRDFRTASLAQTISPVFEQLLVENGLAPRALWFGKRRFKVGDQLPVSGDSLPMLVAGKAKGSLTLTFEAIEAVHGHPCGVFSITGDYNRKQAPNFEGTLTDEEVTIRSGKVWLSMIYPLILKEQLDTIQSYKSGGQGGLAKSGQGSVEISVTRKWTGKVP